MHSPIRKCRRSRGQRDQEPEETTVAECPICLEHTVGNKSPRKPFSCHHVICEQCDDKLYVRADDRCPMCRSARTSASRNAQNDTNEAIRRSAMAQRHNEQGGISATIFFPVSQGLHEMGIEHAFVEFGIPTSEGSSELPLPVGSSTGTGVRVVANDPAVQAVVGGLLHAERVPLRDFFEFARALRSQNTLRSAFRGSR